MPHRADALLCTLACILACDSRPESGAGGASDTDMNGQDLPQCPADPDAEIGFAVEIDGESVWADDRILDLDGAWELQPAPDASYTIDADCETLSQNDASVTLRCPNADSEANEITLTLTAGPALPTIPASVHLQYETHYGTAEFGNPDIVGHAFVLSDAAGVVAAGVLARSELARWGAVETFAAAVGWEDGPLACAPRFDDPDACFGLQPLNMAVSLGNDEGTVSSGETTTLGNYQVLLGVAERTVDAPNDAPYSGGNTCASFELHHAMVVRMM